MTAQASAMGEIRRQRRLLRLMKAHGMAELDYADGQDGLHLELPEKLHPEIRALQAGRFYTDHPDAVEGAIFPRAVCAGDIVGYLKIGPLLMAVAAEQDGVLPAPLVANGDIAGYGDALY